MVIGPHFVLVVIVLAKYHSILVIAHHLTVQDAAAQTALEAVRVPGLLRHRQKVALPDGIPAADADRRSYAVMGRLLLLIVMARCMAQYHLFLLVMMVISGRYLFIILLAMIMLSLMVK